MPVRWGVECFAQERQASVWRIQSLEKKPSEFDKVRM